MYLPKVPHPNVPLVLEQNTDFCVGGFYLHHSYNQILCLIIQHSLSSGYRRWASLQTLPYRRLAFIPDLGVDSCCFLLSGLLWSLTTGKRFRNPHYHCLHKYQVLELLQKPVYFFSPLPHPSARKVRGLVLGKPHARGYHLHIYHQRWGTCSLLVSKWANSRISPWDSS